MHENTFQSSVLHMKNAKDVKIHMKDRVTFFSLVLSTFIHKAEQVISSEKSQEA